MLGFRWEVLERPQNLVDLASLVCFGVRSYKLER